MAVKSVLFFIALLAFSCIIQSSSAEPLTLKNLKTEETLNISNEYYAQMTEECKKSLQEQQKNQHLAQINKKMREADKEVQRDPVYQRINKIINKANESDIKVNDK